MQICKIKKSKIAGIINIPSSKSQTLRSILFASFADGISVISNFLSSPDTFAMIKACESFGASISQSGNQLEIRGTASKFRNNEHSIDAGNSGIVLRFITGIAALASWPVTITGDESIRTQRLMQPLMDALSEMQVTIISTHQNGYAPLVIQGPLEPGSTSIVGQDSQFVSSLLIACAFANGPSEIKVTNPGEKPWVDLTLHWFNKLGIEYGRTDYGHFTLTGKSHYNGFSYTVPGDMSSLAFPLVAALLSNTALKIYNVDLEDKQGDKRLIEILKEMGANFEIDLAEKSLSVKPGSKLRGMKIDINDCIDCITILAVIGCFAEGTTEIINAEVAKNKECNRIECITQELKKMGANITATDDGVIVKKSTLKGGMLTTYHDHRMAMALAVAAMNAEGETIINEIACVQKTYPSFFDDFIALGANFEINA